MLYYLNDSAACPQGDLPWSSIDFSASPEVVDASFWMSISHIYMRLRRDVSKNETFWHDSDPWRIFSTSSRGLWAFPRALTYIYGIPTSFVVEPACATVTSPQSEV